MDIDRIVFIHENKATYPELSAYRNYFSTRFAIDEMGPDEARADRRTGQAICWHVMGFYPKRLTARFVIHDYRSLSIGFARMFKDRVKAFANHKPNLRIFQNDSIQRRFSFRDGVPELLLPMGVPNSILDYRSNAAGIPKTEIIGDFCYIGSMLPERRIDTMIASFLNRYGSAKTLWLYGNADHKLKATFNAYSNIVFPGLLPQKELFEKMSGFGACVCYFPNHYPHVLQTPTKLLEYAALGLRIISNEHPQSRISEREYGITCLWGPPMDMFATAPDLIDWPDNTALDPSPMLWRNVIKGSGIDTALAGLLER